MRTRIGCLVALFVGCLTLPVFAGDASVPMRSFERFEFDSTNTQGVWGEIYGLYRQDETNTTKLEARLAAGQRYVEGGVILPYLSYDDVAGYEGWNEQGVGDLRLYGKITPLQTALLDAGGGFELSVPTGHEEAALGAGEVGYLPYMNATLHLNVLDVGGHFGYRWYSGDSSEPEALVYGGGFFIPWGEYLAVRSEFNGLTYNIPGKDVDKVSFQPGIDIRAPLSSGVWFLFRPTASFGMTDDSEEWGLGASLALTWING